MHWCPRWNRTRIPALPLSKGDPVDHRRASASGFGTPTDPSHAARLLRAVAIDLAARADHRLPGIAEAARRRTVTHVDGDHVVGQLGSFSASAWTLSGEQFDRLTVAVRHSTHQDPDPGIYARAIVCTLAHELAHAYTHAHGITGTTGPRRIQHTEDFAHVATRLGLHVVRRPAHPTVIFTPGLSAHGRIEFADLIERVARGNLARTTGTGYAGPDRFHDLIAQAASTLSDAASSFSTPFIR